MKLSQSYLSAAIPLVIAATTGAACAGTKTVVNADFQAGTAGWYVYPAVTGGKPGNPDDSVLTGKVLELTGKGGYRALATSFNAVTLADGESLTLSLDFHFLNVPPEASNYLNVYLGNQTKPDAFSATDAAYVLAVNTNPAAVIRQFVQDSGSAGNLLCGADRTYVSAPSGDSQVINDIGKHKLKFTITRNGAKYTLSGGVDGDVISLIRDQAITFNTLGVGVANSSVTAFAIDNVKLEHVTK